MSNIRLCGVNCYHLYYPFIPGVSERLYTDEWLDEQNQKEAQAKEWNGQEYNAYQQTQKMRQMETAMRAQREKVDALKAAKADPDEIMIARAKYQAQLNEYSRFCKKMGLKEQRERIYYNMRGRMTPSKRTYQKYLANKATKHVAKNYGPDIMKSGEMLRKTSNTGAFKHLPERMSKKHIRALAKEYNISLDGLKLNIDFNEELLRLPLAGRADSEELGGITFFPNSFKSKEELLRTIFHEKQHVEQFREFGAEYVQENRVYFEQITEALEEEFIFRLKKEGRL